MKKIHVLYALVVISAGYIIVQMVFFSNVSKQVKEEDLMLENLQQAVKTANFGTIAYDNMREFVRVCDALSLPVFVIDPDVLASVVNSNGSSSSTTRGQACRYLCHHTPVIAFGVMHSAVRKIQSSFESSMRGVGFSVSVYMDGDPRELSLTATIIPLIPTHYLFYRGGHVIQLVVLVERTSGFWWHSDVTSAQGWGGHPAPTNLTQHLKFGVHAGAINKMEIVKVEMDGVKLNAPRFPTSFLKQLPESTFVECNYTQARQFHYRYPRDETPAAMLFRKKARMLLQVAGSRVLDPLRMRFWISSGTCLGWFRQCDVIAYSKDVDVGMFIGDYDVRLIAAMQKNNLPIKHLFGKPEDSFELSFSSGDVKLDVFFFYNETDHMWNGGTQARTGNKYKYIFSRFTLCWTEFLGLRVRVPCETEAYIEANYGTGWRHPVKHWDWKKSPPNVRINGRWAESELDRVVQHFELEEDE